MHSAGEAERVNPAVPLTQDATVFRLLVERVLDYAIFMLSPDGTILTWNKGAQGIKGYTPRDIIGQHIRLFYTNEDREAGRPERLLAAAAREGRVEDEGWRVRKDGSRFWADVIITALTDDNGHLIGFAKVTRDLSDRRHAEIERAARLAAERTAERLERLQVATAALAAAIRPEQAAEVLTDISVRALRAAAGVVGVPDGDDMAALAIVDVRGATPASLRPGGHVQLDERGLVAMAVRTQRAIFVGSRDEARARDAGLADLLVTSPFEAWAAIPMTIKGRLLGVLTLAFAEPRSLDADERGFLLALAEAGAQAMDRAHLYESEQVARSQAEAAVRAQDEFLSIAAHELRTPVAAIKATAQVAERAIERGQFDAERTARHLQSIARSSDRLGALIEDLLDVSRLRTGRLQVRRGPVDLGPVVDEIVSRYSATDSSHLYSPVWPEEPIVVHADPLRMEQVLDNLLSNARKYSPNGGVIEIRASRDENGVLLTVSDQGIGLPAGQETRIFEAFGRGSNAAVNQIQGLGLGLAICRQLVELHGGRIWATSAGEGQGTTFSVWLPTIEAVDGIRA
jgi:PAS domain S-box-containing protein